MQQHKEKYDPPQYAHSTQGRRARSYASPPAYESSQKVPLPFWPLVRYSADMTIDEIRRAVAVARYYDAAARTNKAQIEYVVSKDKLTDPDWLVDVETSANNLFYDIEAANAIRRSIRAALGSGKV